MSFGKINIFIDLITTEPIKDDEGFVKTGDSVLARLRAYKEERHGNEKWANRAAFSTAASLFRFRVIPGITVTTAMFIICKGERYNIVSVEDVKERNMYIETLCEKIQPSEG